MPKSKPHLAIKLNLLKPQSNPEKLPIKLFRWLLSTGRYIFVVVEAIVLVAFISRFKLDADLAARKEAIEEQIPYIKSLQAYEVLIRQTQLKLTTIVSMKTSNVDYSTIVEEIAKQTPQNIKLTGINIGKTGSPNIHITGQTESNNDLLNFITGLKESNSFNNVNIASVGLEQGVIKFSIEASSISTGTGGKNL